jgi:UDP-glucuronate 4-epimerase
VFNIGARRPEDLMELVALIERFAGREAEKRFLPMQPGDVEETFADVDALESATGFAPSTPLEVGIERFVAWYRDWARP